MTIAFLVLLGFLLAERFFPRHPGPFDPQSLFWLLINFLILPFVLSTFLPLFDDLLNRLQIPFGFSLLDQGAFLQFLIFFSLQDLISYLTHFAFHRIGWLWQFHAVHHSSTNMTVVAAFKHTWIDILPFLLLSTLLARLIHVQGNVIFWTNIFFRYACLWQHSNINFSAFQFPALRNWIMTPANHRIHHENIGHLHHRNLGFLLTVWDRLLGTFSVVEKRPIRYGIDLHHYPHQSNLKQFFFPWSMMRNKTPRQ